MAAKDKLIADALRIDPAAVERKLESFISRKVRQAGATGVVLGLSGGIDSSVVAALCAKALGAKKVLGVSMPESNASDPQDADDAREMAKMLGIALKVLDIAPCLEGLRRGLVDYSSGARLPNANLRPRVRMVVLYYYANLNNRLVAGCSNRSELRTGYFTKHGDGASDMLPIGCLYKTQVRQLAAHLGIPSGIIAKAPTAGLWKGQTDEGEIGISYQQLDRMFAGLDLGLKPAAVAAAVGLGLDQVKSFIERERNSSHKLRFPEIPALS